MTPESSPWRCGQCGQPAEHADVCVVRIGTHGLYPMVRCAACDPGLVRVVTQVAGADVATPRAWAAWVATTAGPLNLSDAERARLDAYRRQNREEVE